MVGRKFGYISCAVHNADTVQILREFTAVSTGIHIDTAADRTRNACGKFQTDKPGIQCSIAQCRKFSTGLCAIGIAPAYLVSVAAAVLAAVAISIVYRYRKKRGDFTVQGENK